MATMMVIPRLKQHVLAILAGVEEWALCAGEGNELWYSATASKNVKDHIQQDHMTVS
jgi:hypothetical protein